MTRSRPRQIVCVLWRAPGLIYLNADRLTTNMLPPKMTSLYEGGTPSLFTFWSNLPYKSRIRVFLSRISLQMSGFWATCRMSATTFLGSRTTKLLRTLYVCTIPTARKHQLEHHLLPDAICRASEQLIPAILHTIESAPKQKREETPNISVTVRTTWA